MINKYSDFKDLKFEKFFTGEVIAKGNLILFFPKKTKFNCQNHYLEFY